MDKITKSTLKIQIEAYLTKFADPTLKDVKKWLFEGTTPGREVLSNINYRTLQSFINYQMKKFKNGKFCISHKGGNGRPRINKQKVKRVKNLILNKENQSSRSVAARVGICQKSVVNIMKRENCKAYHKYKVQKLTEVHKEKRLTFAREMLSKWGLTVKADRKWGRLVNSDFSAKIRISSATNTKNDIVWSSSRSDAGDLLEAKQEKFSAGEMIWGAVSYRGLIPKKSPIFVSDLCMEYEGNPKNINSNMYCDMIKEKVGPAVLEVYPEGNAIFQDDAASIHRTDAALQTVSDTFHFRLEHSSQAPKTADIWPIENVWGMIKSKVSKKKCENKDNLKK